MPETTPIPSLGSTDATTNKGQWACNAPCCGSMYVPKRGVDQATGLCDFCVNEAARVKRERSRKTPRWEQGD